MNEIQKIQDAYLLSTISLVDAVMNWSIWTADIMAGRAYPSPIWRLVEATRDDALAFYASLDDNAERRAMAAEVLVEAGWTLQTICFRMS